LCDQNYNESRKKSIVLTENQRKKDFDYISTDPYLKNLYISDSDDIDNIFKP
jgi:hypothetical protein